jgi:hypothetical protein
MPPGDLHIGEIDHAVVRKAHDLVESYPANCVRIQEIRDTMVYRYTHGRLRVATWFEEERGILWICAADERDDETYDYFVGLHNDGELLPGSEDSTREQVEAAGRFARAVQNELPGFLQIARDEPGREHRLTLSAGGEIRLFVSSSGGFDEIWVAMPNLKAPAGLTPQMRGLILAKLQLELPDAEWEERYDWPAGGLLDYEIAYLGVREL